MLIILMLGVSVRAALSMERGHRHPMLRWPIQLLGLSLGHFGDGATATLLYIVVHEISYHG